METAKKWKNIDNEIVQRWVSKADKDHSHSSRERKSNDTNFGKITDFVLDILNETEEIEGNKRKILRLALDEDEYLINYGKQ